MENFSLFISDLHLSPNHPEITQMFYRLLKERAVQADALYILGDFFESWIGDDYDYDFPNEVAHHLRDVADEGIPIYFVPGNRDFLCGHRYAKRAGWKILKDPTLIDLYGKPTLVTHGDTLCSDDKAYLKYRKVVRNPIMRFLFLKSPLRWRKALMHYIRRKSEAHTTAAPLKTMDATMDAIENRTRQYRQEQMIHGHTHNPMIHDHEVDGKVIQRIVLGAWHDVGSIFIYRPDGQHALQTWH